MSAPFASALHPDLAAWFGRRFPEATAAQRLAVPAALRGESLLLSSPTGTGKTLAAFLAVFDTLRRLRDAGEPPGIVAVYVSPLRALAYDLQKNLHGPLAELGWDWVRVGARTGDTDAAERARQRRQPPHILVTTPESLCLLVSQKAWREALAHTRFLVVDEVHALAENKRGVLLAVAAERLESCRPAGAPPLVRIGLSATVRPLELLAAWLCGGRPCAVLEAPARRRQDIAVLTPLRDNPYPPSGYTGVRLLGDLARLVEAHATTLVFTNTRSGAESIGLQLKRALPGLDARIEVHHASLDRSIRLDVEDRLKRGELRCVVCSTSLELGVDIGSIDLVVLLSAPKGVARALQRLGRAGHAPGAVGRGLLAATNINDLAECAVTAAMMRRRELEPLRLPELCFDVLAQHLAGLAVEGGWTPEAALDLLRRAWPYRALGRDGLDAALSYLAGGGAALERAYAATFGKVLVRDGVLVTANPGVARSYWQNVGTIVSEPLIAVRLGGRHLGQVEESFLKRLVPGDVFVLNGRCVRLLDVRLLTARVARADAARPTVPRWNANKMPLASGLCAEVVRLRTGVAERLDAGDEAEAWLRAEYALSALNARAFVAHFRRQASVSEIPVAGTVLVEVVPEGALRHVTVHSLVGRAANDALARIVAARLRARGGGSALATVDDYGFLLTIRAEHLPPAEAWPALLAPGGADADLAAALDASELVKWHFRGVAQTALMVPRRVHGDERAPRALQWSAEVIFEVLRKHEPAHPLLEEARAEARLRFLDAPAAARFLESTAGLAFRVRELDRVSPFAFGIHVSRIQEAMTLEDPEAVVERLYHELFGGA